MGIRTYLKEHKDGMGLMGSIISTLNRIENELNAAISSFFIDFEEPHNQERVFLMSDILNSSVVFCKFEEKLCFFQKLIERLDYIAKTKDIKFNKTLYLDFCKKIKRVQEYRNEIAHNYLMFTSEGLAEHYARKSYAQLLAEQGQKKGSIKKINRDLKQTLEEVIKISDESDKILIGNFQLEVAAIIGDAITPQRK